MKTTDQILAVLDRIEAHLASQNAELLGREQLAVLLSISTRTLDQMAATPGALPTPIRLGARVLYRRRDVIRWLDELPAKK